MREDLQLLLKCSMDAVQQSAPTAEEGDDSFQLQRISKAPNSHPCRLKYLRVIWVDL